MTAAIAALIGLVGVIAGGFVSFLTQLVLLRRAERARTRAAAHVLREEVLSLASLTALQQLGSTAQIDTDKLLTAWDRYRDDLVWLPLDAWYAMAALTATFRLAAEHHVPPSGSHLAGMLSEADRALERAIEPARRHGVLLTVMFAAGRWLTAGERPWMCARSRLITRVEKVAQRGASPRMARPDRHDDP